METNENDLAFPFKNPNSWDDGQKGLTKREYFAALAMQGIEASNPFETTEGGNAPFNPKEIAERAVQLADALIQALNSKRGE